MTRVIRSLAILTLVAAALIASAGHPGATSEVTTDGLVVIDSGSAAFYSQSYDYGGWSRIIQRRIGWGQHDPATYPYSDEGYYCVHPDYVFGNVLTLRNPRTGVTLTCTIGDNVALGDQAVWRRRWVIEVSHVLFVALGLEYGNTVEVLVLP